MDVVEIQQNEYKIGSIWEFLDENEKIKIKSFYDTLIKFKDNKEFVTFLYSCGANHPIRRDSAYYNEEEFLELKTFVEIGKNPLDEPHQQNKLVHTHIAEFTKEMGINELFFDELYSFLDNLCAKIVNKLYSKNITAKDFKMRAQLTWYTEGDFIKMHDDGPINDRLCGVLIYLTPEEFYKAGNGGELVLKNKRNTIDIAYPTLGTYAVLDFTKNTPVHAVHKVIGDFNRFAYLNFVILNEN